MSAEKENIKTMPSLEGPSGNSKSVSGGIQSEEKKSEVAEGTAGRKRKREKTSTQIGDTEWWVIDDPEAEKPYYYNAETSNTAWRLPPEVDARRKEQDEKKSGESANGPPSDGSTGRPQKKTCAAPKEATKAKSTSDAQAKSVNHAAPSGPSGDARTGTSALTSTQIRPKEKKSTQIGNTEWWMVDDPAADKPYFYNADQNKTVWTLAPELMERYGEELGLSAPPKRSKPAGPSGLAGGLSAALVQNLAKSNKKKEDNLVASQTARGGPSVGVRSQARKELSKQNKRIGNSDWWMIQDPAAHGNRPYYYNAKSDKTQWTWPAGLPRSDGSGADISALQAARPAPAANGQTGKAQKTSKQIGSSEWWIINDPGAERPYYYNTNTQKTQWMAPKVPEQPRVNKKTSKQIGNTEWWEIHDPTTAKPYYYNSSTQRTTWDHPFKNQVMSAREPPAEPNDDMAALSPTSRTAYNSRVSINSLSCAPVCEAKARAVNLVKQLQDVNKQKKMWQQRFGDCTDKLALVEDRNVPALEPTRAPPVDSLVREVPEDAQKLKQECHDAIESMPRLTVLSALSTADLRQALSLKVAHGSQATAETIFKFLYQPPLDNDVVASGRHPTQTTESANRAFVSFTDGARFATERQLLAHVRALPTGDEAAAESSRSTNEMSVKNSSPVENDDATSSAAPMEIEAGETNENPETTNSTQIEDSVQKKKD
eukprot:135462_1